MGRGNLKAFSTERGKGEGKGVGAGRAKKAGAYKRKRKGKGNKLVEAKDRASSAENLIVSFSCLTLKYRIVEYNTVFYSKIP